MSERILLGQIAEYDDRRGLGVVAAGEERYPFHCTAIADGSRHIEAGTAVAFRLAEAHGGATEARALTPVPGHLPEI